jgi:alpha-mannosidase
VIEARSDAPGCNSLTRRYKLVLDQDFIEIENIVDKKRAPMPEKIGDWFLAQNENKESVNFAFPFNVPGGIMRLDLPIGSMIPWEDQIPSACKNWYTVGRYADVSNHDHGISWFTLDAPLVEVGEISATLVGSQSDPDVWRKEVEPTQKLYSWAMNNHWGTNYRQYQEGPVTFRYALRPHGSYDAAETYRIATGMTQPLKVRNNSRRDGASSSSLKAPVEIDSEGIVIISLKPADDGDGLIARLYNPGTRKEKGRIITGGKIWLSNTAEEAVMEIPPEIELGSMELVTIRLESQNN